MHSQPTGPTPDPKPGERVGDYEILRPVARGGMATVLAVRDTRTGEERGMKLLLPLASSEDAATRFRMEFRALSRLHHPGILQVFEWGLHGDRPWFTMELLQGRVLKDEVERWAELPPQERFARVEQVLMGVTRALAYVHDRGLVHRDITPANIMILEDGRAKLMDFGVVKDLHTDMTAVGEVIGTIAYISPEQILGEVVDARADLYSLGAVLYLMLTGKRPFSSSTLQGFMEKHLHDTPRPPREHQPLVPLHLDEICLRLLAKAPGDRYASAVHLLHVLGGREDMVELEGRWPPASVGRTLHKARMREAIDDLVAGKPGQAILLTGTQGQGKTRMLDLAETYARGRGLIVARGRCRAHDRPFGPFYAIYRALSHPNVPEVLHAVLGSEEDEVVRERYPVIAAFKDLVVTRTPCVVLLDNLDRAEPATLELLVYLIRNTLKLASERVTIILTLNPDADADGVAERQLVQTEVVHRHVLQPLDASDVEELVLSMLPNDEASHELAGRLFSESNGSPAFIADMLRGLVDDGLIVKEADGWRLLLDAAEITRSRLPIPASLRQVLADRLAPLPPDALEVVRILAISRRHMDLDILVETAPFDEDRVMEALDVLVDAGIAEERRTDETDQVDLARGRFRDVVLESMPPDERQRRHQQYGQILERAYRYRPAAIVEELAFHFENARLAPKAYSYLVRTASRHLQRSLFAEGLAFLERALTMEPTARPFMLLEDADRTLAEVYLGRSLALYHLGKWDDALSSGLRAETLAIDVGEPALHSRIAADLGYQHRNRGNTADAERALRTALSKADEAGDIALRPMPMYTLGSLMWGKGQLDEAERLWRDSLKTAQQIGDERAEGFGYNGLGILAICKGNTAEARSNLEQSARLFEELGMLGALSIARVNLVELYLNTGILRKALALADRTVSQAREVQLPHGIALGLSYRSQVLLRLGRRAEARQNAERALALVRQLGTAEDEVVPQSTLVCVHLEQGDPVGAMRCLNELLPVLEEHDTEGVAPLVAAWHASCLALLDRKEEGVRVLETGEEERRWPHIVVRTELAQARAWKRLGRPDRARETLVSALDVAEECGFRFFQLQAHDELCKVVEDPTIRARHGRIAKSLARSLAANLTREDGQRFLARGWGEVPE